MARTRIRGRGTIDWPERPDLDGVKVFLIGQAPDGRLIVVTRSPLGDTIGTAVRVPRERVRIDPS